MNLQLIEAVKIFAANHEQEDRQIVAALRQAGYPLTLAERVVALAPIAFGRELLSAIEDAVFSGVFVWETGQLRVRMRYERFGEFQAFAELAHNGVKEGVLTKDEFMTVAEWSCEVAAVSKALRDLENQGKEASLDAMKGVSFLENAIFGFDHLLTENEFEVLKNNSVQCITEMGALLTAHGVDHELDYPQLNIDGHDVAFSFDWFGDDSYQGGQLDVHCQLGSEQVITESFVGHGKDEVAAIKNAFENFAISSLHVLLQAFMGLPDPEQVLEEIWDIQGNRYQVFIGNFANKVIQGEHPGLPDPQDLFDIMEAAIKAADLNQSVHALRFYMGHVDDNNRTFEALLDNQLWPEGMDMMAQIPWFSCPHFYSTRLFMVLKKTQHGRPGLIQKVKSLFAK